MQAQLRLPRWGAHAVNNPKTRIVDIVMWIPVARDVENVEEVGSEAD